MLPSTATPEQKLFWSEHGPMWDRTYALDEDEEAMCERAREACDLLGVRHLVMGHTPHFEGPVARCGGRVLLIDTGSSPLFLFFRTRSRLIDDPVPRHLPRIRRSAPKVLCAAVPDTDISLFSSPGCDLRDRVSLHAHSRTSPRREGGGGRGRGPRPSTTERSRRNEVARSRGRYCVVCRREGEGDPFEE